MGRCYIHQSNDLAEKGLQVSVIGEIFKKAIQVCVWIGEHDDGSEEYIAAIPKLDSLWDLNYRGPFRKSLLFTPFVQQTNIVHRFIWRHRSERTNSIIQSHLEQFAAICERGYWQRIWIFQEITLARRVMLYCGNHVVDFSSFCDNHRAMMHYCRANDRHIELLNKIRFLDRELMDARQYHSIVEHLSIYYMKDATDTRDMVYALLPLIPWSYDASTLQVDYTIQTMGLYFQCLRSCDGSYLELLNFSDLALRLEPRQIVERLNEDPTLLNNSQITKKEVERAFKSVSFAEIRTYYERIWIPTYGSDDFGVGRMFMKKAIKRQKQRDRGRAWTPIRHL